MNIMKYLIARKELQKLAKKVILAVTGTALFESYTYFCYKKLGIWASTESFLKSSDFEFSELNDDF